MKKTKFHYGDPYQQSPDCRKCSLRRQKPLKHGGNRPVWGHGPRPASIMIILEAPGINENYKGIPACGATGDEIDAMLFRQGLHRRDVYVTNVCKCMPVKDSKGYKDPTDEQIEACAPWLRNEIESVNPRLIVAGGRIAAKAATGLDLPLELTHGFVYKSAWEWVGPECATLVAYHPAAGMHNPRILAQIQQDWGKIAKSLVSRDIRLLDLMEPILHKEYKKVDTEQEIDWFLERATEGLLAIDTEDGPDGRIWSLQATPAPGFSMFITDPELWHLLAKKIRKLGLKVILHNSLHDLRQLSRAGIEITDFVDTMILAYLLQDEPQGLKVLSYRHARVLMRSYVEMVAPIRYIKTVRYLTRASTMTWPDPEPIMEWRVKDGVRAPHIKQQQNVLRKIKRLKSDIAKGAIDDPRGALLKREWYPEVEAVLGPVPDGYLCDLPLKDAMSYACLDSDITYRVYTYLHERIIEEGLETVADIDHGVVQMTLDMMRVGILADREKFAYLHRYFQREMKRRAEIIFSMSGKRINLRSFPQLSQMLYDHMGFRDKLPDKVGKKTGDTMTSDEVLAQMEPHHPVFKEVRGWRDCSDLDAKFAVAIPAKHIQPDGRVRCQIMLTRTETGRMATKKPNLMAMPTRTEDGKKIRSCFVAKSGCKLLHMDYSQIELRILSWQANVRAMITAFNNGDDIHRATAAKSFSKSYDEVEKSERYAAKRINFGVVYGITGEGLYRLMGEEGAKGWTVETCNELIDHYLHIAYPEIGQYMEGLSRQMLRTSRVSDWAGRIRLTPGVRLAKEYLVEAAMREGCNMPIQSGAQEVIKMAQACIQKLYERVRRMGYWCWPLLQIHDALLSEVDEEILYDYVIPQQKQIMETIIDIPPGIKVDVEVGDQWGELEKYDTTGD